MSKPTYVIAHNAAARRFEAIVEGKLARADYELRGQVMRLYHTEVPRELEGRGLAGALVDAAIAHARATNLRVEPACSYVRSYMRRHPETHALLPEGVSV